jgi:hypothetical protein
MAQPTAGVHALAVRLAPEILDEAVDQARDQARARLAAALADEIVAAALAADTAEPPSEPVAEPAGEPVAEPPRGDRPANVGLYAYGITDATSATDDIIGLDDRTPVQTLRVGEAALVMSPIELELLAGLEQEVSESGQLAESGRLASLAGRHDRVLGLLLDRGPVLPLRFGTVLPDRPRAQRLLRASSRELAGELDRVRDHREWGLRVTPGETRDETTAEQSPATEGEAAAERSGTAYLSARRDDLRRAALREERLTALTRGVNEQLAALATEVAMRSGRPGPGRLNAAYLVAGAKEETFLDAATTATQELTEAGCDARLTGPWPPYSFVRLTLGEVSDG